MGTTECCARADTLYLPPLLSDNVFTVLESRWDAAVPNGAGLDIAVRTSTDGVRWSEWTSLHPDSHGRDRVAGAVFGDLVIVSAASYAQYRVDAQPNMRGESPALRSFALTAVNAASPDGSLPVVGQAFNGSNIIARAGWGADEKIRFDKTNMEIWTPEYRPIQKVFVHHTVTRDPETDARATIRAIYQYHAVSRGWGDIGYNYLIDPQGNVYEGRFGGQRVVGGHTLGYNYGSLGIAMIGTYTDHTISGDARTALLALIKAKAGDLDPTGKGFFVDRDNLPNIMGHRGMTQTSCPGDSFYPTMNNVRRELKGLPLWTGDPKQDPIAASPPDVAINPGAAGGDGGHGDYAKAVITDDTWSGTSVVSRDRVIVTFNVKNVGSTPFQTQDPPPTYVYAEGETYVTKKWPTVKGSLRLAIGPEAQVGDPPYRWGLGRTLKPGETINVPVSFRVATPGRTRYVASLIYEGFGFFDQDEALQVTVVPNPADPAQEDTATTTPYFAETKHNMAPEFREYWNKNGGLSQFGFPITEPFTDVSTDDGKAYKTQYFERARFEYHPENKGTPYEVLLGRLGVAVSRGREGDKPFGKVEKFADAPDRRFFAEVGHGLKGEFKQYWDAHGGLPIFGFPISEEFEEKSATDGRTYIVQYFERNRFEYHPENKGTPQEVLLGLLGTETVRRRGWIA